MADEKWWLVRGKQVLAILRLDGRSLFATGREVEGECVTTPAFEGLRKTFEEELVLWRSGGDDAAQRWFALRDWLSKPGLVLESGTSGEREPLYWVHFCDGRAWWLPLKVPPACPAPDGRRRHGGSVENEPRGGRQVPSQGLPRPLEERKLEPAGTHPLAPITCFWHRTQAVASGNLAMAGPWIDSIKGLRRRTIRALEVALIHGHGRFRNHLLVHRNCLWFECVQLFPPKDVQSLAKVAERSMDAIGGAEGLALTDAGEIPEFIGDEAEWVWDRDNPTGPILRRKP